MQQIQTIHPKELLTLLKGSVILDVRTKDEHDVKCLTMAHLEIPLDQLNAQELISSHGLTKQTSIYVLCARGARATRAAQLLLEAGFESIFVIEGGLFACEGCAVPTHSLKASRSIPLDAQVRMGIGGIIILFSILTLMGLKGAIWLMILLGVGLIISSATGFCALTELLAKAPWNKE